MILSFLTCLPLGKTSQINSENAEKPDFDFDFTDDIHTCNR